MRGHSGHNTRPHSRLPLSCLCMDDLTTDHIFDPQATWVIGVLGYFLTLSMGVCTTRHWQTSGRLVQELNVCTVHVLQLSHVDPLLIKQLLNPSSLYFLPNCRPVLFGIIFGALRLPFLRRFSRWGRPTLITARTNNSRTSDSITNTSTVVDTTHQ